MALNTFIFESFNYKAENGELVLRYSFENGEKFEEKIFFPPSTKSLSEEESKALDASFRLLFLLAGVSYYKAYAPEKLVCRAFPLDEKTAAFMEKIYRNGLGEFSYKNNLDLSGRIKFSSDKTAPWQPIKLALSKKSIVPVGGGKDSIVTFECLKKAREEISLFAVGTASGLAEPIKASIMKSGLPALEVKRVLSPNLSELNRKGAFNGHVPITAIISSIAISCAILHGFNSVIMSNEASANEPNIKIDGREINHQYSKSLEFEKDFASFIANHISGDLNYFSFLRPLTETAIASRFAELKGYHHIFRSCNSAFRIDEKARGAKWCGNCPKCRFVFLALAPFMGKERIMSVFGKNLLDDETQIEGFAELCGLSAYKPFECVGTIEESSLLMLKLAQIIEWKDDFIVRSLAERIHAPKNFEESFAKLFELKGDHFLPPKFLEILRACM